MASYSHVGIRSRWYLLWIAQELCQANGVNITVHYLLIAFFIDELNGEEEPLDEEALAALMPLPELEVLAARSFLMRFWAPVVKAPLLEDTGKDDVSLS